MREINKQLRIIRMTKGLSQKDIDPGTGYSQATNCRWEKGTPIPSIAIYELTRILKCTFERLFTGLKSESELQNTHSKNSAHPLLSKLDIHAIQRLGLELSSMTLNLPGANILSSPPKYDFSYLENENSNYPQISNSDIINIR
jgi:DNA-binding transcriptional regulator YiaG